MRKFLAVTLVTLMMVLMAGINVYGEDKAKEEHGSHGSDHNSIVHKPVFGMYVKSYYEYSADDEEVNTFHTKFMRPWVKGQLSNFISYKVQAEFAHEAQLLDAFIDYKISPMLSFRVGQWKVPFSTGWLVAANDMHFVTRELGKKLQPQRDRGAAMTFTSPHGHVTLTGAVFNGSTQNHDDHNKRKDIVLRGTVNPVKALQLALGYYNGKTDEHHPEKLKKLAASALVNYHHFTLLSEVITVEEGTHDKNAFVALAGYGFPTHSDVIHEVKPYARFDTYDPDYHDGKLKRTTLGLNFYFHDHYNKFQLNYEIRNEEGTHKLSNNRFMAAVQVSF